jgi:hypothetical protein
MAGAALLAWSTTLDAQQNRPPGGPPDHTPPTDAVKPKFENRVSVREQDGKRLIDSNGIPNHDVGNFPRRGNPNSIAPQDYHFQMPLDPQVASDTLYGGMHPFGIAVNGVVFDPAAAEWWQNDRMSGWQYEPKTGKINLGLDINNAHVQPNGAYHYHGIPTLLVKQLNPDNKARMTMVGWAADGFPIYARWDHADAKAATSEVRPMRSSYKIKQGTRPGGSNGPGGKFDGTYVEDFEYVAGSGDLDSCGGRMGPTPENPDGIYHYVLTDDYPFIPRLYKGTPDQSFFHHGPPPGQQQGRGGRPPGGPPPGFGPPR